MTTVKSIRVHQITNGDAFLPKTIDGILHRSQEDTYVQGHTDAAQLQPEIEHTVLRCMKSPGPLQLRMALDDSPLSPCQNALNPYPDQRLFKDGHHDRKPRSWFFCR